MNGGSEEECTIIGLKEELAKKDSRVQITISSIIEDSIATRLHGLQDTHEGAQGKWVNAGAYLKFQTMDGKQSRPLTNKKITISSNNARELLRKLEPTNERCTIM